MAEWQNRIVGVGSESPEELLANPRNWRIHPMSQQEALLAVLRSVGIVQTVIVNRRTGFVVDGHLRVLLALRSEQAELPVTYVDLSDEEEATVLASFDAIGALAVPDNEKFTELLGDADVDVTRALLRAQDVALPERDSEASLGSSSGGGGGRTVSCPECGADVYVP